MIIYRKKIGALLSFLIHTHAMILSPNKKVRLSSNKRACQESHNKSAMDNYYS